MWENVYAYDRDFRMHLSHHPGHNWGIILHQVWVLRMKDRVGNKASWSFISTTEANVHMVLIVNLTIGVGYVER